MSDTMTITNFTCPICGAFLGQIRGMVKAWELTCGKCGARCSHKHETWIAELPVPPIETLDLTKDIPAPGNSPWVEGGIPIRGMGDDEIRARAARLIEEQRRLNEQQAGR